VLTNFFIIDLEFVLRFERPMAIAPLAAGSMLRGAFGTQLRRIVCHDGSARCWDCRVRLSCAYEKIFSPLVPPEADRLSKQRDLPRGFVLKPPLEGGDYGPDRPFAFRMILVGELIQWLPYIIVPFSELGRIGIGRDRTPFQLERIVSRGLNSDNERQMYEAAENLVRVGEMIRIGFEDMRYKAQSMDTGAVSITFLTPTILRFNASGLPGRSSVLRVPEFHVLVKRLRDRVNRLATVYCGGELEVDHRAFGRRAEEVRTASVSGRWVERTRKTRSGNQQDLGGFVGEVTFVGEIDEFLPLLLLGQYVHVGKNAPFGGGWYEVGVKLYQH